MGGSVLRLGGFHLWDCVERVAKRAYNRGLDVLVDEDLTELFTSRMQLPEFRTDRYPCYRAPEHPYYQEFLHQRKGKPWLWQDYSWASPSD
ncbi:MAG: hypothetical protein ACQESG_04495 [Nanobdellota archaeon]